MTPLPAGLDALVSFVTTSHSGGRHALTLQAIVAELMFRGHARYRKRDVTGDGVDETFCNVFAQDVAEAMDVALPRHTRANDLCRWLAKQSELTLSAAPALPGWALALREEVQLHADAGRLALATWRNPAGSGHMAVVLPALLNAKGLWVAQAGLTNSTRMRLEHAFGSRPVTFYVHP